jgi:hypothetical protein
LGAATLSFIEENLIIYTCSNSKREI